MVSGTVDKVETKWAIDGLILDPENARHHTPANIEAIAYSLNRFGQQKPVVVLDTGLVKAGNGTVMAAKELGWTQIWVHVTDLSEEDADKYAIADNRSAELAVWEDEVLTARIKSWPDTDSALFDALGFDQDYLLEPDLSKLDIDIGDIDLKSVDVTLDTMIVLRIQLQHGKEGSDTAQQEIQAVCDKYGLILESRVQI